MTRPHMLAALLLVLSLCACAEPLPPQRAAYVGEWRGAQMYLLIGADGSVHYKRLKGGANVEITAPLKAWHGDDFEVGFGPFSTRFVVSRPPALRDGRWTMTVDGVELVRTGQPAAPAQPDRPLLRV